MRIENHRLVDDTNLVDLTHKWAPDRRFRLKPTHIVIHYDVCHGMDENTRAQFASGLFYHVAVDGFDHDGRPVEVRQYCPLDLRGSHSKGWNDRAVGLVIVNPGPLILDGDGFFRTVHGRIWSAGDVYEGAHKRQPEEWRSHDGKCYWAAYSYEERDTVLELCRLIVDAYPTITTICGHDYISPGRKFDPGPAADDAIIAPLRGAFPQLHVPEAQA